VIAEKEREAEQLRSNAVKREKLQKEIEYVLIRFHIFQIIFLFF